MIKHCACLYVLILNMGAGLKYCVFPWRIIVYNKARGCRKMTLILYIIVYYDHGERSRGCALLIKHVKDVDGCRVLSADIESCCTPQPCGIADCDWPSFIDMLLQLLYHCYQWYTGAVSSEGCWKERSFRCWQRKQTEDGISMTNISLKNNALICVIYIYFFSYSL